MRGLLDVKCEDFENISQIVIDIDLATFFTHKKGVIIYYNNQYYGVISKNENHYIDSDSLYLNLMTDTIPCPHNPNIETLTGNEHYWISEIKNNLEDVFIDP